MSFFLPEGTIDVVQGASELVDVTVSKSNGDPQDLTGAILYFTVKIKASDQYPVIQKISTDSTQIEIPNPTDGKAKVYLRSSDTAGLLPRRYVYDIWVSLEDGTRYVVVPTNILEVKPGVTTLL